MGIAQRKGQHHQKHHHPHDQREQAHRVSGTTLAVGKIHALSQIFTWLEVRHAFFWHPHLGARFRIAAHTGRPIGQRKRAEPSNLDAMTMAQGFGHRIEEGLHRKLTVTGGQRSAPLV